MSAWLILIAIFAYVYGMVWWYDKHTNPNRRAAPPGPLCHECGRPHNPRRGIKFCPACGAVPK